MLAVCWRFSVGVICGLLAMGAHVYVSYGSAPLLAPPRLFDSIGSGVIFGHGLGFAFLFIHLITTRLTNRRTRFLLSWLTAAVIAAVAWWTHHGLFLANTQPDWFVLLTGGFAVTCGVSAVADNATRGRRVRWFVVTAVSLIGVLLLSASGAIWQHPLLYVLPNRPLIAIIDLSFVAIVLSLPVLFSAVPGMILMQDRTADELAQNRRVGD